MKTENLLNAIGDIREDWIDNARKPHSGWRKFQVIVAAVILCMVLAVSGLAAADVDGVYEFLYAVSPDIAQTLKPVRMSCVDNGIELEVISAEVSGDTARIFIGLRDLEGDRVDDTCDLYDSYEINLPSDMIAGCSFAEYDEATDTALFLVEITRGDGKPIKNDKITFSLGCFLSGKREYKGPVDLDLSAIPENPEMTKDFISRGYGASSKEDFEKFDMNTVMVQQGALCEPVEGITVTAVGYVDGSLRIQTHYENILKTENHGYVFFKDKDGREIFDVQSISFWDEDVTGSYDEQEFDLSPEELENLTVCGYFRAADEMHSGDWEITFPVG